MMNEDNDIPTRNSVLQDISLKILRTAVLQLQIEAESSASKNEPIASDDGRLLHSLAKPELYDYENSIMPLRTSHFIWMGCVGFAILSCLFVMYIHYQNQRQREYIVHHPPNLIEKKSFQKEKRMSTNICKLKAIAEADL